MSSGAQAGAISYLALMRLPGAAWLAGAAFVGRIPAGMGLVAVVLLIHETTGSYGIAGAVVAGVTLSRGVTAGVWGRAADRVGYTPILLACAALNALALAAMLAAARAGAANPILIGCGVLCGATVPSLHACMPRMWAVIVGERPELESSLALEAITRELIVITGPIAAALLVALASPDAAIAGMIVLMLVGTIAFAASPLVRAQRGVPSSTGRRGALGAPAVRTFALVGVALGVGIGIMQIAIPAFADQHGSRAAAGGLFACWAVGSLVAGLWYGRRRWRAPVEHRYALTLALLPLSFLLLSLAGSLPAMAVLMLLAGLPMAPTNTAVFMLINRSALPGTATEAQALYASALTLGMAAGNTASGQLVTTAGPSWTIAAAAVAVALATPIVAARRATLQRPTVRTVAAHP